MNSKLFKLSPIIYICVYVCLCCIMCNMNATCIATIVYIARLLCMVQLWKLHASVCTPRVPRRPTSVSRKHNPGCVFHPKLLYTLHAISPVLGVNDHQSCLSQIIIVLHCPCISHVCHHSHSNQHYTVYHSLLQQ